MGEVVQGSLFGLIEERTKRPNPLRAFYGPGPEGASCRDCIHLLRFRQSARWQKCALHERNTGGRATDHLATWPACGRYEKEQTVNEQKPLAIGLSLSGESISSRALARTEDPDTSKDAARQIVLKLGQYQAEALALVKKYPGSTQDELARFADYFDSRTIGRRLPELAKMDKIRKGEPRVSKHTGRRAATWWPL